MHFPSVFAGSPNRSTKSELSVVIRLLLRLQDVRDLIREKLRGSLSILFAFAYMVVRDGHSHIDDGNDGSSFDDMWNKVRLMWVAPGTPSGNVLILFLLHPPQCGIS